MVFGHSINDARKSHEAMRRIRIWDEERATNNVWSTQLKRELVEDYWVAKTNEKWGDFEKRVLVGGVLGSLGENGFVQIGFGM